MIAKIISHGSTRRQAIAIMKRALDEFIIEPIKTTVPFNKEVLLNPSFLRGRFTTSFADKLLEAKEKAK